jgi:ATP-dependent metalloprotease FtsH
MNQEKKNTSNNKNIKTPKFNFYWIYGIVFVLFIGYQIFNSESLSTKNLSQNEFKTILKDNDIDKIVIVNRDIANIYIKNEALDKEKHKKNKGSLYSSNAPMYYYDFGDLQNFEKELNLEKTANELDFDTTNVEKTNLLDQLFIYLPFIFLIGLWIYFMRRMSGGGSGGGGGQIFSIGKSKAKLFDQDQKVKTSFKDVAGLEGAKEEVQEIVDFLKSPDKYTSLGGKIPKGALLVGPPGTGKTLLAKAVAGEAEVPFFSLSGSDFVEMFVGVGASRVRDLFKQAREKAPCIVFIDEIDAIGRSRGKGAMQGGNDERENTLNQLLVEMDGFSTDKGVILMAATNRPDVLDSALLRPGRFDRQIGIDLPDLKGRGAIFEVHLKSIKTSAEVSSKYLAEMTPGFAGADIANVCNEAALVAARHDKKHVELEDFNYALDRVIGGLEKKNKLISPKEKEIIAYHEAGHAICGWYLEHASPLIKVTIVPRGIGTLGYAQYLPKEEYIIRKEQLLDRMCMTFGGRAAEKIVFDKISTGAQNDLDQVTQLAYGMVVTYGMNNNVGNVSFYGMSKDSFTKPYSEETSSMIDSEVRILVEEQYKRAQELLKDKRKELDILAKRLLEKEVILKKDIIDLIGDRPFEEERPLIDPEHHD